MAKSKLEELPTVIEWVFKLFLELKNNGNKDFKIQATKKLEDNIIPKIKYAFFILWKISSTKEMLIIDSALT